MSWDDHDKRWMAYLDGQMTASEALDFEETLSERDRARLAGEVRLESAISDALSGPECCPADLWSKLSLQMRNPAPAKPSRTAYWFSRTAVVLAATAAIVFTVPYYEEFSRAQSQGTLSGLGVQEASLDDFRRRSEVPPTYAAAQNYLRQHNIDLKLVNLGDSGRQGHHQIEFVGVCEGGCPEKTLFELRFICCGKPAKVLIAKRGTSGERILREAARCDDIRETRTSDGFIMAVISSHESPDLLNIVQPAKGNLV